MFDFNDSLNGVAPFSLIPLSVDNEKEWIVDGCHLCDVSFVLTPQIECCECCV